METLRGFVTTSRLNKLVIMFQMLLVLAYQSPCDNDGVLSSSAMVCWGRVPAMNKANDCDQVFNDVHWPNVENSSIAILRYEAVPIFLLRLKQTKKSRRLHHGRYWWVYMSAMTMSVVHFLSERSKGSPARLVIWFSY